MPPPPTSSVDALLAWIIGGLLLVIGVLWTLYTKGQNERITEKDKIIDKLTDAVATMTENAKATAAALGDIGHTVDKQTDSVRMFAQQLQKISDDIARK